MDCLKLLRKAGADVAVRNYAGRTPLHDSSQRSHIHTMEYLVGLGADINARDNAGRAPLHIAALDNQTTAVRKLIKMKSDINARDFSGSSVLGVAVGEGFIRLANLLRQHGAKL